MIVRILSFLHIFLLITTRNVSLAQEGNSQETQHNEHYESSLSINEMKNKCNYEDPGRRFSNEINNIGKCMIESGNNIDLVNIDNNKNERSLIALAIENYNEEDSVCHYCNVYPNFDDVCPLEYEN